MLGNGECYVSLKSRAQPRRLSLCSKYMLFCTYSFGPLLHFFNWYRSPNSPEERGVTTLNDRLTIPQGVPPRNLPPVPFPAA